MMNIKQRNKAIERARGLKRDGKTSNEIAKTIHLEGLTPKVVSKATIYLWLKNAKPIRKYRKVLRQEPLLAAADRIQPAFGGTHPRLLAARAILDLPIADDAKDAALAGVFRA